MAVKVKAKKATSAKKPKYSAAEKTAYGLGRAYEAGKENKRVALDTAAEQASFRNGMKSVKEKKK